MTRLTLALYDEPWRETTRDRPGIRVRVYPDKYRLPRDYYPTRSRLVSIMALAWTHEFHEFEMRGKPRIAIRRYKK